MTAPAASLAHNLARIVGRRHLLTDPAKTQRYRSGYRTGGGNVAAVVRPATLVQLWQCTKAALDAGAAIIMQASNTGLTGGSTPDGDDYGRPVVLISTRRIRGIHLLDGGRQSVCLAGATLHDLEARLEPLAREPHSVLGSSCIGASVIGGICNNSGGALVSRGPAYTEMALFARIDAEGRLELINHLGIDLGFQPEKMLARLDAGDFAAADVAPVAGRLCSDIGYHEHVREIDAATPARYNADPRRLFETAGCAGKLIVFAVRLDSFAAETDHATFYIGTNAPQRLTALRRRILGEAFDLPISAEYIHREAFDMAARFGKDVFLAVHWLGTKRLPAIFALRAWADRVAARLRFLPAHLSDRLLQRLADLLPTHLPQRILGFRAAFEHHLILKLPGHARPAYRALLDELAADGNLAWFACDPAEARAAELHRFTVAGAAVRFRALHTEEVEDILALDVALARNDPAWSDAMPAEGGNAILHMLHYGHFMCHVFHRDYILRKGTDAAKAKAALLTAIDRAGGRYPAEHSFGHQYAADPTVLGHYRAIDPTNSLNPGIGHAPKGAGWTDARER